MAFQTSAPGTPVQYRDTRPKGQLWWRQIGWRHVEQLTPQAAAEG